MYGSEYVQRFDAEPQFWQFLRGLRSDDLIVELIQNDLDANASRTSIDFTSDRLICQGDGEPVSEDGWQRLSFVMGAGVEVESKRFRIGVKNHGLKACFWLGDEIIVRSNGLKMIQTLYKDGYGNRPSPGTLPEPVPDSDAPPIGCSIEVPYRTRELEVTRGEGLTIRTPDGSSLEGLFTNACELLPGRLLGVVRPGIRHQYTLCLRHHSLGSVEIHWRAKRRRIERGRGRRQFHVFTRECETSSKSSCAPSTAIQERACTFRLPFPAGKRPEIPDFFFRDRKSFWAEIAWLTDKGGRPRSIQGVRRYPIGYDATSQTGLTGVGVHFSGPYVSDAERHGTSHMNSLNAYIDDACKDALVDIMSGYLLHRHGGRAMELYLANSGDAEDETLNDLVERTVKRRALPLADRVPTKPKPIRRLALGPRKTSDGTLRRVVLPMYTWDQEGVAPLLAKICPREEDQIDKSVPGLILSCLVEMTNVITFDENDVIERLQPELEATYFPWQDNVEWQAVFGNPSISKVYLDVLYETIQRNKLATESEVRENIYLPDDKSRARPLVGMYSAVNLPPNLGQQDYVPLLHPELQAHRLLRKRAWKPEPFRLEEYLDKAQLEKASLLERKSFWTWLRDNWKTIKRQQTLIRITNFPIWPSANGDLLPLNGLCEPRSARVTSIMGDAIVRPSHELLKVGIVKRTGRSSLTLRNTPLVEEFEDFLVERLTRFPPERELTANHRRNFHKLEKELAALASSVPRIKEYLGQLDEDYRAALNQSGNLRNPGELVRDAGEVQRLHLLGENIIDRPHSILDRIDGWKPRTAPSTDQIVDTFRRDGTRLDAHVPRIREYIRQSEREDIHPVGLLEVPCIPVEGQLRPPHQLALRGRRDFWGDWKIRIPVTDINAETQRLYRIIGVVSGTPNSTSSRRFFQWLESQNADVVAKHADRILRHINHEFGPRAWSAEHPQIPFIIVESDGGKVRLVTTADATKRRSTVVIPDFDELEEAIRQHPTKRPVEMAIVDHPQVTEPVTARLRELGLRTLSDYVGDPVEAVGAGNTNFLPSDYDFRGILDSLQSGLKGTQLQKRLAKLDLDTTESALRSNWRERLARIQDIRTADSVTAIYKIGRSRFSVPVDGKLDKESGTLWIRSDSDLRTVFFDVVAEHVFELPKKYFGSVLDQAYKMEMRERYPLEYSDAAQPQEDTENDDATSQNGGGSEPSATAASHPLPKPDPLKNIPNPGPIPQGNGVIRRVSKPKRAGSRPQSADENAQIADLKEKQYAWHCQACLAEAEPKTLAPLSSYVEGSQNRRRIMEAQHCDHVNAGGARHVGNILLLCHYHHRGLGDAVTRTEVTRALGQGSTRWLTFNADNGVANTIQGKIVTIHPPQRQTPVSLFFTREHADYWLTKATEERLL
ncbi:MAG: hypothetical protein OXG43_05005 [Chloroflexi bacterium]|nr:hypothetical protein [Chloroflexota bacterium]